MIAVTFKTFPVIVPTEVIAPAARLIEIFPLLVATFPIPIVKPFVSLTVSALAAPVTFATSVVTLVVSVEVLIAVTFKTLPVMSPVVVTLPVAVLSVTFPVPAVRLPVTERFPLLVSVTLRSPLFVETILPAPIAKLPDCTTVSPWPFAETLASIDLIVVLRLDVF